jgi:hypothetical protein
MRARCSHRGSRFCVDPLLWEVQLVCLRLSSFVRCSLNSMTRHSAEELVPFASDAASCAAGTNAACCVVLLEFVAENSVKSGCIILTYSFHSDLFKLAFHFRGTP